MELVHLWLELGIPIKMVTGTEKANCILEYTKIENIAVQQNFILSLSRFNGNQSITTVNTQVD